MAAGSLCLFYRFCCSAVSRWSRSSASNRICCQRGEKNPSVPENSHEERDSNRNLIRYSRLLKTAFLNIKEVVKILHIVPLFVPLFNISNKGVASFGLPQWARLSSPGRASASPPPSSSPPCCSARHVQTPSSPSHSSSAPAVCLWVQPSEKSLSGCGVPADAGEKKTEERMLLRRHRRDRQLKARTCRNSSRIHLIQALMPLPAPSAGILAGQRWV